MNYSDKDYHSWLNAIEETGRGLTTWEEEFVEDMGELLERGRPLSERQADILERIYAEKTP